MQSIVASIGDDDSALVVDANAMNVIKLAWLIAKRAEHEQERAIDQRQYLHSIVEGIGDDDSMSIMVDRHCHGEVELARLRSLLAADREQEREIDRRQEHQSIVVGVGNDDATMMLVDRDALRKTELNIS